MKKLLLLFILTLTLSDHQAQNGGTWTWIHGDSVAGTSNFGTKGVSSPTNLPPGRYHPAYWQDLYGNFWVFSGSVSGNLADLWKYNPTINQWTWMSGSNNSAGSSGSYGTKGIPSTSNYPSARIWGAACWTDSVGDLWLFGGSGKNDLWRYNISTNEWTWIDGDNPNIGTLSTLKNYGLINIPSSTNFPGMRWECKSNWLNNNNLILFGGGCQGGNCNDIWEYSIATKIWTWIGGSNINNGNAVYGTVGTASSIVTPSAGWTYTKWKYKNKLYIYGGNSGGGRENVWSFDLNTKLFTCELQTLPASNPPSSNCLHSPGFYPGDRLENHTIQSSECNRSYWSYGGFTSGFGGSSSADLWLYYMDSNYWMRVSKGPIRGSWGIKGVPNPINHPPNKAGFGIWNDVSGNLFLFSGFTNFNDMWKFEPDPACLGSISLVGKPLFAPKKKSICHPTDSVVMTLDTSFFNITWSPSTSVTVNTDTSSIIFKPKVNTSYTVTAQGGKCTAFDTLTFMVKMGAPNDSIVYDTVCTGTKWAQYPGSGIYNFVLTNQSGCDSNVELHLLKLRKDSFINVNICQGSSYTYHSTVYNTAGSYLKKLTGANGCDSNMTLNLKVNPNSPLSTLVKKVCEYDTFKYNGSSYTSDIIFTHILTNKFGCDSPVKLNLTFLPVYTAHIYDTFCSGDSFKFSNNQYYKTAGNYSYSYKNQFGCDSNIVLHLAMTGAGIDTIRIDSIVFGNMCSTYDKKIYIYPLSINNSTKFSLDWGLSYQPQSIFHNLKAGTYNIRIKKKCAIIDTVIILPYRERDTTMLSAELCQGSAFLFNNVIQTTTGIYWDTFINKYSCDSFLRLDLKIWKNDTTHLYDSICEGSSVNFDFQTLTAAGDYSSFTQSSHFCDSTTILHLYLLPKPVQVFDIHFCDRDSFTVWDSVYKTSGSIMHLDTSQHGCDSTTWYNINVHPVYNYTLDRTICKGDTFTYFGQKFYKNGIHTIAKKTAIYNCDSVMKITLTVNKKDTTYRYDTISSGDTLYYLTNKYSKAGIYKHNFKNMYNCDSILYLNLIVHKRDSTYLNFQRCNGDSLIYIDSTWKASGNYRYNLKNKKNVDSFIFINLLIKNNITSLVTKSICRGQSYLGYKLAGTYFDTFKRAGSCDSIRELRVLVNDTTSYSYTIPICKLESYFFNGQPRSVLGTYKDTLVNSNGCDSFIYLTLTRTLSIYTRLPMTICSGQQFKKFKTTGIYNDTILTTKGCDSIEEIDLKVLAPPYKTPQYFEACVSVFFKNKHYKKTDTVRDTLFNYLNCDSVYRTTFIKIRPEPKLKEPRNFIFCDSFFIGNRRYTFSFDYTDTIRTSDPLRCDSTYQRTAYILKKSVPMYISASPNLDEYIIGESLFLETNSARNIFWSSGETKQKINIILNEDKTYQVIGWNDEECKDTASIFLRAVAPAILDIPQAFSPNGKSENQIFKPNYNGKVQLIQFIIFNRWGEKIFSAKDINQGWDGSYKSQAQPAGVYSYMLEYKMNRNIYFKSGEVLMVR